MVLNDLIGELEKVELAAGDLVRSILHDVIDKAVSLYMSGREALLELPVVGS